MGGTVATLKHKPDRARSSNLCCLSRVPGPVARASEERLAGDRRPDRWVIGRGIGSESQKQSRGRTAKTSGPVTRKTRGKEAEVGEGIEPARPRWKPVAAVASPGRGVPLPERLAPCQAEPFGRSLVTLGISCRHPNKIAESTAGSEPRSTAARLGWSSSLASGNRSTSASEGSVSTATTSFALASS